MIPVITSVATSVTVPFLWPDRTSSFVWIAAGPLLFAAAVALIYAATSGRRWAVPSLMALLIADLGAYGLSYAVWPGSQPLNDFVASASLPPDDNPRVALPDAPDGLRFGNRILLAGATRVDGYAGLEPATSLDRAEFARLAGARWQRSPDDGRWQPIERPVARARFLDDESATAEVIEDRPGRIVVQSNNAKHQTLAITERFHSGWTVATDNEPADAMCVNADFVGCIVPPGEHLATFTFQPASLRYGRWISLFGLGLWGLIFAVGLGVGVGSRFARRT